MFSEFSDYVNKSYKCCLVHEIYIMCFSVGMLLHHYMMVGTILVSRRIVHKEGDQIKLN